MKIKCDYCDNTYEDTLPQCPYCEAPNPSHKQVKGAPKTIGELKQWYIDRNLPPYETTRFFIGENHQGPRAFGIYQDPTDGEFVVYKNKNDGSRAVRYKGKDEEYAVNELYQKLKDEIVHQKANSGRSASGGSGSLGGQKGLKKFLTGPLMWLLVFILFTGGYGAVSRFQHRHDGYYNYNNTTYYNYDDNWFYYDNDYFDWYPVDSYYDDAPSAISESYDDYYVSGEWNTELDNAGVSDWEDTEYYEEFKASESSSSDYDSDYDWDSGSDWDSGGTDWDSDW